MSTSVDIEFKDFGYFDSDVTGFDDATGLPIFDRAQNSEFLANMLGALIGNGVYPNPSTNLQVIERDDAVFGVQVLPGKVWIDGRFAWPKEPILLEADPASTTADRIDIIVVERNNPDRKFSVKCITGAPATSPVPPSPERTTDIHQRVLCQYRVRRNATKVNQADILDTRMDNELCGYVTGVVEQIDGETLFAQIEAMIQGAEIQYTEWFNQIVAEWEEWWNDQQDRDGYLTAAGQNPSLETNDKTVLGAINELCDDRANENLLVNGAFQVWQRDKSFDLTSVARNPFADQWFMRGTGGATISYDEELVRIKPKPTAISQGICQPIEWDKMPAGYYTLSVRMKFLSFEAGKKFSLVVRTPQGDQRVSREPVIGEFATYSLTVNLDMNDTINVFVAFTETGMEEQYSDYDVQIEYVKLEVGMVATKNIPKSYAEEEVRCKRYYRRYIRDAIGRFMFPALMQVSTGSVQFVKDFDVEMYGNPTVTGKEALQLRPITSGVPLSGTTTFTFGASVNLISITANNTNITTTVTNWRLDVLNVGIPLEISALIPFLPSPV